MEKTRSIHIEDLAASYAGKTVLEHIDLDLPSGAIIGIIGPNGCGKSTLLKAVLGLIPEVKGQVHFFGKPFSQQRQRIAYVPQRESVDWDFPISVREVVEMGIFQPHKWWRKKTADEALRVQQALEKVGMQDFAKSSIGALSGGQQQRVFVARALVQAADILILDEPFVGIDVVSQEQIWQNIRALRDAGKTILIVHHDLQTARSHFDELVLIHQGRIAAYGKPEVVLTKEHLQQVYSGFILLNEV